MTHAFALQYATDFSHFEKLEDPLITDNVHGFGFGDVSDAKSVGAGGTYFGGTYGGGDGWRAGVGNGMRGGFLISQSSLSELDGGESILQALEEVVFDER